MEVMTIVDLASRLNLDRSNVLKKVKKRGFTIWQVRRITNGGLCLLSAISQRDATIVIQEYEQARAGDGVNTVKPLAIDSIRCGGGTQMRAELSVEVYMDYRDKILAGVEFPPLDVFFDGSDHWLADGFHRFYGHREAKKAYVKCNVHNGTLRDAIFFAACANQAHGLRRTQKDKRNAVEVILNDPDWVKWSDRKIAEQVGVGHPLVSECRRQLKSRKPPKPSSKPVPAVPKCEPTKPEPKGDDPCGTVIEKLYSIVRGQHLAIPVSEVKVLVSELRDTYKPSRPAKPAKDATVPEMFAGAQEHLRQALLLADKINEVTGRVCSKQHENVLNSIDIAAQTSPPSQRPDFRRARIISIAESNSAPRPALVQIPRH